MSIFNRIVEWNKERNLIKSPALTKEVSFIVEELLEMTTNLNSDQARDRAEALSNHIIDPIHPITNEQVIDAAGDIIVFATGLIVKMGYDPDRVMDEVLKEIESRKGEIIDGKFVKDKSEQAMKQWYKADFNNAKL